MEPTISKFSPIELIHPQGYISVGSYIGGNVPERLIPANSSSSQLMDDLILFAPNSEECRRRGWLKNAIAVINRQLDENGFVYALIPWPWRLIVQYRFKQVDIHFQLGQIHLPDWENSQYIIPLKARVTSYLISNIIPTNRYRRLLAFCLLKIPGGEYLLSLLLPTTGLIFTRNRNYPFYNWLSKLGEAVQYCNIASLCTSWKGNQISSVMHCFSESKIPNAVIKVCNISGHPHQLNNETSNIEIFEKSASDSGAKIPKLFGNDLIREKSVILESTVLGKSGAVILSEHPEQLPITTEKIINWLINWNIRTISYSTSNEELLERELFEPLHTLLQYRYIQEDYIIWLRKLSTEIKTKIPSVAVHQDLTVWNILLDKKGGLGIVDWSEAYSSGLPLVDFFYSMVDAVAVASHMDHMQAFKESIMSTGDNNQLVKKLLHRLCENLHLSGNILDVCLHASFIHHALKEQSYSNPESSSPFLHILRSLNQNRTTISISVSS